MEDMERYGDYNDAEDEAVPPRKSAILTILKTLVILVIVGVIALLGYRLFLFDYYPPDAKQLIMTERLRAHYAAVGDDLHVQTQKLRFPYDDCDLDTLNSNDLGTFFADHLYVITATGELQITTRANTAGLQAIATKYGSTEDVDAIADKLIFRLTDNYGREYTSLVHRQTYSHAMYRYFKLCFDGIDFTAPSDGLGAPEWIRLEILFEGEETPYSYMLIYENNVDFSSFKDYRPSKEELS